MKNLFTLALLLTITTTTFCADKVKSFKPFKATITSLNAPASLRDKT
jgi:hypothetical protein